MVDVMATGIRQQGDESERTPAQKQLGGGMAGLKAISKFKKLGKTSQACVFALLLILFALLGSFMFASMIVT